VARHSSINKIRVMGSRQASQWCDQSRNHR
jgi:hypothetical protein